MAGTQEAEFQELQRDECSFVWDDESKLYYHASTGFYHDPDAGWYYSSRDGMYYKFEDGHYLPLEYGKGEESKADQCREMVSDEHIQGQMECVNSSEPENPSSTSEWLEETLIDLYLTGYPNSRINATDDSAIPLESDGSGDNDTYEIEEGEWIHEDFQDVSNERVSDEVASCDEENWRAQYGQVVTSREEDVLPFRAVDLWDWAMVKETVRKKKHQVARLVGRLVKPSMKLHPSLPSSGGILKTSAICEVHFDLVRVASGEVYRLRSPSMRYLASLSTYDSCNPTKDWGFPELLVDNQSISLSNIDGTCEAAISVEVPIGKDSCASPVELSVLKCKIPEYRDRAAARRALHGGFGVGPGQKNSGVGDFDTESSPPVSSEEAAAEALNNSFGAGSYARRILESMGWKEGEGLGNTNRGLTEPLNAVGNKGYSGLGWENNRFNYH
ncbi:RNA-binding protein 5 isoform X1 [Telopea speciosissima]|uniref:RNA-binding protein 5 isoform X1 n=1 Tax=Telopea speciosissima TaxID=54955 RepID=UPI001CC39F73|nr:RNA-binding protein 5 isoform X1 [Telopea speciosissima]